MSPFLCIKLKDGDTLFAEHKAGNTGNIIIINPLVVKTIKMKDGDETFSLSHWIPFVDDTEFVIPMSNTIYVGALNSTFIKFYGMSCMREELMKVHRRGFERVQDGELKSVVYKDLVKETNQIGHDYSIKYGIDPELAKESLEVVDLDSDAEDQNKKLH